MKTYSNFCRDHESLHHQLIVMMTFKTILPQRYWNSNTVRNLMLVLDIDTKVEVKVVNWSRINSSLIWYISFLGLVEGEADSLYPCLLSVHTCNLSELYGKVRKFSLDNYQTSDHDVYSVLTIVQPTVNSTGKTNTNDKQGKDPLISLFVKYLGSWVGEQRVWKLWCILMKKVWHFPLPYINNLTLATSQF